MSQISDIGFLEAAYYLFVLQSDKHASIIVFDVILPER